MVKVLAVIPARMGSQRIPRKNALEIEHGLSLAQHAVDCALWSGACDRIVVSTDDPTALPIRDALVSLRPEALATGTADIASVVRHELACAEANGARYDYCVTLQPAVLARSPLIVSRLVRAVVNERAGGGLTMCPVHPWIWTAKDGTLSAPWLPGPYPRSQDSGRMWQEINSVQVASAEAVRAGKRWSGPLAVIDLPGWASVLDVDTPEDLAAARDLWPWAKPRLASWEGAVRVLPVGGYKIAEASNKDECRSA